MSISLYDLTYGYLKRYSADEMTETTSKSVFDNFAELLERGWTSEVIVEKMKEKKEWTIEELLTQFRGKPKGEFNNLLKPDAYYWHPQLRIIPAPAKRIVDYDSGDITKVEQEYFLEMRASYTLHDLYDYYTKQHGEPETQGEVRKWRGALKYLLGQYSLDSILFMIDVSSNHIEAEDYRPLNSPLDMADYIREAQSAIGQKITDERTAGDEGIVPKRRVPLSRGRSKTTERELQAEHYA